MHTNNSINRSRCFLMVVAKERDLADAFKTQILIYPATANLRENYESPKLFDNGNYYLKIEDCEYFVKIYWDSIEKPKIAFPSLATRNKLSELLPALIFTTEADILRDEAEQYARQLTEARVSITCARVISTST